MYAINLCFKYIYLWYFCALNIILFSNVYSNTHQSIRGYQIWPNPQLSNPQVLRNPHFSNPWIKFWNMYLFSPIGGFTIRFHGKVLWGSLEILKTTLHTAFYISHPEGVINQIDPSWFDCFWWNLQLGNMYPWLTFFVESFD